MRQKLSLQQKHENWEFQMSDWELVPDVQSQQKTQAQSDWELISPEINSNRSKNNESFGMSALKAPYRALEDVYRGGMGFIKDIPEYWKAAKTEVPGAYETLKSHPGHALMQALAGSQELINNLAQTPKSLAAYGENRLNLLPKGSSEFVGKYLVPEDTSEAIHQLFGEPQYPGEKLLRGIPRNALNIYGAGKLASILNPTKFTYKNMAKDVINTREKNINHYGKLYQDFWKESEDKGFGDALHNIDINMPVLKKYSGDKSIKGVLDFDINPTIENAHAAKSDLLKIQRELNKKTTLNTAERQQKNAANNAINSIKANMFKDLSGNIDRNMLNKYENIQGGYRKEVIPYKNKAINEFLRDEMSEEELINSLSKRAFARKRGQFHPRIKIKNKIKKHPYLTGAGLGAIGSQVYKNMFGDQSTEQ